MSLARTFVRAGLAAALAIVALAPARAQEVVRVTGYVLEEGTGRPVEAALVTVEGRPGGSVTDEAGAFAIDGLPTGLFRFRIERLGFLTTVVPTVLERSTTLLFQVARKPIVADRIEVVINVLENRRDALPYAARSFGPRRLAPHLAIDLERYLRRSAGLHLVPCPGGRSIVPGPPGCLPNRGRPAPLRVWIDEAPAVGGLDATFGYPMTEIHSVEVIPGCQMVRVYTRRFMEAVADGRRRIHAALPECTVG